MPDGNTNNQRPDLVPGVSLTPPGGSTITEWINPAAFAIPGAGTFGNAPRNIGRGPGALQIDFGVGKHLSLNERAQVEFRAEFFNILNHPQYGLPQADISANPANPTGFGHIISSVNTGPVGTGTPRQIQFMFKAVF